LRLRIARIASLRHRSNQSQSAVEPVSVSAANSRRETVCRSQRPGGDFGATASYYKGQRLGSVATRRKSKIFLQATGNRLCAGLRGGGRIPATTGLQPKFPANRENNREFFNFWPFWAILAANRRANSCGYNKIPYAGEQGINLTEQGRFWREQGISVQEQDSRIW
jgi:hypothetical protein